MRKLGGDKKGQGLQLSTIILIVLGIAVLVFLIFGFYTGWSNLWERITNFAGGKSNLDTIKQGCAVACTGQAQSDWCNDVRTVRFGKEVTVAGVNDGKAYKSRTGTCEDFVTKSKEYPGLSVDSCGITCPLPTTTP